MLRSLAATATLVTATLVTVTVVGGACSESVDETSTPPRPPTGDAQRSGVAIGGLTTVGVDDGCVDCHPDVVAAYRSSAMHGAMTLPTGPDTPEARLADRTVVDPDTGIEVAFETRDQQFVQTIRVRTTDGLVADERSWPVHLVVGSGRAARSYFTIDDGQVFQLPLTWYRELGEFALSPGPGFRDTALRFAPRLCVECHTGAVTPRSTTDELGFTGKISLGIACSRCHGDGTAHSETGDPLDIVNPARLDLRRQSEVCFQCHLSGDLTLPVPGTSLAAYTPGEELGRHVAVFAAEGEVRAGSPISGHAARLAQSACATGDATLTCTTCHNPHAPADAPDTRGGCLVCHAEPDCAETPQVRGETACAACHMSTVPSSDIEHTSTTDHLIARRPAPAPARAGMQAGGTLVALALSDAPLTNLLDPGRELPGADLGLAEAYLYGAERAAAAGGNPRPYLVRAKTHLAIAKQSADTGSVTGTPRVRLAESRYMRLTERPAEARRIAEELVSTHPESIVALTELGQAFAQMGDAGSALWSLERAWAAYPYALHLPLTIAEAHVRTGEPGNALKTLRTATERLGPSVPLASRGFQIAERSNAPASALRFGLELLMFRPRDPALRRRVEELLRRQGENGEGR